MSNDKTTAGIRVFVYGTLKEGHGNHGCYFEGNDGATLLGRCTITGPYVMRSLGFFPCVSQVDGAVDAEILGEVYQVDGDTLDALDMLEGHPSWYVRHQIDTPWKKAWCYFMPEAELHSSDDAIVASGCWNMSADEAEWLDERAAAE